MSVLIQSRNGTIAYIGALMFEPYLQCLKGTFKHQSNHTSELQCMNADQRPMVADVSLFEVADSQYV